MLHVQVLMLIFQTQYLTENSPKKNRVSVWEHNFSTSSGLHLHLKKFDLFVNFSYLRTITIKILLLVCKELTGF